MDIKAEITKVVDKVTKDEKLMDQFKKNPVKAVESVIGVDLPDDVINKVVDGVKAKISIDKLGGIAGNLKNLF
ncbi:MAG: hypothetical protein II477_09235 [Lachnospiraceae bacterium]|nr:hypothetical protein [Lachnospiraceae bacterium]MBQ2101239.1 hypothetical protein [Lachnospiraceae bacterium]MBQ3906941.1 hypothetical protein [Lachnospiraceae bacterium]